MTEVLKIQYIKRTQKDYSYAFKLAEIREVEAAELEIKVPTRKYERYYHKKIN